MSDLEAKYYLMIMKRMEDKLKEYMGEDEYKWFSEQIAREAFREFVNGSPNDAFKKVVLDNWKAITGEAEEEENE